MIHCISHRPPLLEREAGHDGTTGRGRDQAHIGPEAWSLQGIPRVTVKKVGADRLSVHSHKEDAGGQRAVIKRDLADPNLDADIRNLGQYLLSNISYRGGISLWFSKKSKSRLLIIRFSSLSAKGLNH